VTQAIPRESKRITYSSEIRALKLIPFTAEQLSIVKGSLLGDGCLHTAWPGTSKNYVFSKMHSVKQREYVEWVHKKLQPFTRNPLRLYEPTKSIRLRTIGHSALTALMAVFYRDGKKILPSDIADIIADPLALAVWFMDDGNSKLRNGVVGGYNINTQSFSQDDNVRIINILKELYGIDSHVERNHKYFRIGIYRQDSREKFRKLISRHVLPSMQYKLG